MNLFHTINSTSSSNERKEINDTWFSRFPFQMLRSPPLRRNSVWYGKFTVYFNATWNCINNVEILKHNNIIRMDGKLSLALLRCSIARNVFPNFFLVEWNMESETCLSEEVEGDLKVDNHTARSFLFHRTKFNYEIVPRIAQWRCAPQLGTFYWTVVVCFFPLLE